MFEGRARQQIVKLRAGLFERQCGDRRRVELPVRSKRDFARILQTDLRKGGRWLCKNVPEERFLGRSGTKVANEPGYGSAIRDRWRASREKLFDFRTDDEAVFSAIVE